MGQEKEIFRAVYDLLLKYMAVKDIKETAGLCDEACEIGERFGEDKLCMELLQAVISHVERKLKAAGRG